MDGKRNTHDAGKATGDVIVTAETSLSVPLHVTFDEPLATVCPDSAEEDSPTIEPEPEWQEQPEPADATVNTSVQPSLVVVKPSTVASNGTRSRRRSRKSKCTRRIRSRSRRNRKSDDQQSQRDSDLSVTVQIAEEVSAGDHICGVRKTTGCLPLQTDRPRPRSINRRRKSQYRRKNT